MCAEQYFVAFVVSSTLANWNCRIENYCVCQLTLFFNKSPLRNATTHQISKFKVKTEISHLNHGHIYDQHPKSIYSTLLVLILKLGLFPVDASATYLFLYSHMLSSHQMNPQKSFINLIV